MLYLYDNAIVEDLQSAIDSESQMSSNIRAVDTGSIVGVMAQLEEDKLPFPLICVMRDENMTIDANRSNFSRLHVGHVEVIDPETNTLYLEKAIPIELNYAIHVLTTNTADMDELVREILFRYSSMYFLTISKPYEADSKLRFGIAIPPGTELRRESTNGEYISQGKLYETIIPIKCDGAVLLDYTPKHMERLVTETKVKTEY